VTVEGLPVGDRVVVVGVGDGLGSTVTVEGLPVGDGVVVVGAGDGVGSAVTVEGVLVGDGVVGSGVGVGSAVTVEGVLVGDGVVGLGVAGLGVFPFFAALMTLSFSKIDIGCISFPFLPLSLCLCRLAALVVDAATARAKTEEVKIFMVGWVFTIAIVLIV